MADKADAKTIRRVENLLRLAKPSGGSSEHERASAALEAAKLIAEFDLVVRNREEAPAPPKRPRTPRARPQRPQPQSWVVTASGPSNFNPGFPQAGGYSGPVNGFGSSGSYTGPGFPPDIDLNEEAYSRPPPGWVRSIAARDAICADPECRGPIERGEKVWARPQGFTFEYLHIDGPCNW